MPLRFWLGLFFISSCLLGHATGFVIEENLRLEADLKLYPLSQPNIIHHSESVMADSLVLIPQKDYVMDYKAGTISFTALPPHRLGVYLIFDPSARVKQACISL
ncbi:MAG: hypothetical protein LRZ88_09530 [Candidatus Cloacimonetes bacterium]|nr:hypothetical protein [Candidatus Cloacimonadota bacterium]